jgi:hypothetical protein
VWELTWRQAICAVCVLLQLRISWALPISSFSIFAQLDLIIDEVEHEFFVLFLS